MLGVALDRDDVDRVRLVRVDLNRETEIARQIATAGGKRVVDPAAGTRAIEPAGTSRAAKLTAEPTWPARAAEFTADSVCPSARLSESSLWKKMVVPDAELGRGFESQWMLRKK